jgi:PAT family beta-lactamase induction signal transducer AmpG
MSTEAALHSEAPAAATSGVARGASPLLWVPTGYFTMALAYVMLTSVTAIMFKNLGMDNGKAAEYASYLILAYTIKPLFAPLVEMYRTKKFFVLCAQFTIALGFAGVALAMSLPDYMVLLVFLFTVLSFIGATQDIAADGVYVTSLDARSQSLYCGIQSLSWNIGPIVASGGLVYLSGWLHTHYFHHDPKVFGPEWIDAWRIIFFIVAGLTLVLALWHTRTMPDGARAETPAVFGRRSVVHPQGLLPHLLPEARRVADDRLRLPVPSVHRPAGKDRSLLHGRSGSQGRPWPVQ